MNSNSQTSLTSEFAPPLPLQEPLRQPPLSAPSSYQAVNVQIQQQQPQIINNQNFKEALERGAIHTRQMAHLAPQSPHEAIVQANKLGDISPNQAQQILFLVNSHQLLLANRGNPNHGPVNGQQMIVNNVAHQNLIPQAIRQKQEEQLYYNNLFVEMTKQNQENKQRRTRLFSQTELAEVTDLQAFGSEDALRISNQSAIDYLGPLSNRKPRNSQKNGKEKETISNSKKQKIRKQQLNAIVGVVTQQELYEKSKDTMIDKAEMSIAMRREMLKEAKREVQKQKQAPQCNEREEWQRMIQQQRIKEHEEKLKSHFKQQMLNNFIFQNKLEIQKLHDFYSRFLLLQDFIANAPQQQVTNEHHIQLDYIKVNLQKMLTSFDPSKRNLYLGYLKNIENNFKARKMEVIQAQQMKSAQEPLIQKRVPVIEQEVEK